MGGPDASSSGGVPWQKALQDGVLMPARCSVNAHQPQGASAEDDASDGPLTTGSCPPTTKPRVQAFPDSQNQEGPSTRTALPACQGIA